MALVPPPKSVMSAKTGGVVVGAGGIGMLPPAPTTTPPVFADITNSTTYIERLVMTTKTGQAACANEDTIVAAEIYKASLIKRHLPEEVPQWLGDLVTVIQQTTERVEQVATDVAMSTALMPILFANLQAGNRGLFNPTLFKNGWAPILAEPIPRTRDELANFTVNQCIASAANLRLGPLHPGASVLERRRQIASRLGISIDT